MPEKIEVEYRRAKLGKRFLSYLVDVFLLLVLGVALFAGTHAIAKTMPYYQEAVATRVELQLESGLYLEDGTKISKYAEQEGSFSSLRDEKDYLSARIEAFYTNKTFFSDETALEAYRGRQLSATEGGLSLFIKTEDGVKENDVKPEYLVTFYLGEINHRTYGFLTGNEAYATATRALTWSSVIEVAIALTVSYLLLWLIPPLTFFKRGRQTIGKKIFKIGILGVDALNIPAWKYLLRAFFILLVEIHIAFLAFLLPLFVSIGMLFLSKRRQSLADYVLNQYLVDCANQDIYLDYGDYLGHKDSTKEASIENTSFRIHDHFSRG